MSDRAQHPLGPQGGAVAIWKSRSGRTEPSFAGKSLTCPWLAMPLQSTPSQLPRVLALAYNSTTTKCMTPIEAGPPGVLPLTMVLLFFLTGAHDRSL